MNIFEYAARYQLRFGSTRGALTVEQLWAVPLRSNDDFNLDQIARGVSRGLETASEKSFVETQVKNPAQERMAVTLDVLKHVIGVKLAEEEDAKQRADNKLEKAKLLSILAEKQDGKLSDLSEKELKKRIDALKV